MQMEQFTQGYLKKVKLKVKGKCNGQMGIGIKVNSRITSWKGLANTIQNRMKATMKGIIIMERDMGKVE